MTSVEEQLAFFAQQLEAESRAREAASREPGDTSEMHFARKTRAPCLDYIRQYTKRYTYQGRGPHRCRPDACQPVNADRVIQQRGDRHNPLARPGRGDPQWYLCKYGTAHYCNGATLRRSRAEEELYGPPCVMNTFDNKEQRCMLTMRSHGYPANGLDPRLYGNQEHDGTKLPASVRRDQCYLNVSSTGDRRRTAGAGGLQRVKKAPTQAESAARDITGLCRVVPGAATRPVRAGEQGDESENERQGETENGRDANHPTETQGRRPGGKRQRAADTVFGRTMRKRKRFATPSMENDVQLRTMSNRVVDHLFYSSLRAERYADLKKQMEEDLKKHSVTVVRLKDTAKYPAAKQRLKNAASAWRTKLRQLRPLGPPNDEFRRYVARIAVALFRFLLRTRYGEANSHVFEFTRLCFAVLVGMYDGGHLSGHRYLIPPCAYVRKYMPGPTHYETFGYRSKMASDLLKHMHAAVEGLDEFEIPYEKFEIEFEPPPSPLPHAGGASRESSGRKLNGQF